MNKTASVENMPWHGHLAHVLMDCVAWAGCPCHENWSMGNAGGDGFRRASNKLLILSGLACLTFFPPLLAADPLVVLPSGDFSCEVKVTPHDSPKKEPADPDRPASELKKIAIVQVGDVRLDELTWTDGSVSQMWTLLTGNLSFQANKNKSLKSNLSIEANKNKSLYALTASMRDNIRTKLLDFTPDSISWISPKTLTNGGKEGAPPPPILHYQKTIPLDPELENSNLDGSVAPVKTIIIQAWIDSKTLRPLKFDNGHALYTLTFADQTPTTIPPMPETVQAEFKKWIATSGPARHR